VIHTHKGHATRIDLCPREAFTLRVATKRFSSNGNGEGNERENPQKAWKKRLSWQQGPSL